MCGSHIPAGSTCDRYRVTRDDDLPRAGTGDKPLCDHGQSGGAMQVGYALAIYGADAWLD